MSAQALCEVATRSDERVRLLERDGMEQIDAYASDEALDEEFAQGFGDLSVHEVAVHPRRRGLAYLFYYSGGLG